MTHPSLHGGVTVITGAAGGLGSATARRLAAEGMRLVLVDVAGEPLARLARELGDDALAVLADVAQEADVHRYIEAGVARFGHIDYHHLNAGISGSLTALPDITVAEMDTVLSVNVRGVFLGLRAAFRQYAAQTGPPGAIVLTASIASLRGSADLLAYQTSKHATLGLLRGAAVYGGPLGIRVNAVAPGIVPTELFAGMATAPGGRDDMTRRAGTTPLRRPGTGAEIASVVAFLMSDDAAYMTGEVVSVDGGAAAVSIVRPSGGAGRWDTSAVDEALYAHHATSQSGTSPPVS